MRKKFIGVYALMAVLALGTTVTSCVDDTESAAVTEIRNLKLQQLQALVTYNAAQAKMQELQAKIAEATYDTDLAAAIAKAQKELQDAEQAIKTSLNEYQAEILLKYTGALDNVNEAIKDIAEKELEKKKVLADSSYKAASAKKTILEKEGEIKGYQAEIEVYKTLADNKYDELKAELKKVDVKIAENNAAKAVNTNAGNEANAAYEKAQGDIARRYVKDDGSIVLTKPSAFVDVLEPTNTVALAAYTLKDIYTEWQSAVSDLKNVIDASEKIELEGNSDISITIFTLNKNNEIDATKAIADYVATKQEELGDEKDKETESTAYGKLAKAKKDLADAEKALAAAEKALAAADEDDPNYSTLKEDVEREKGNVRVKTQALNTKTDELESDIEEYNKAVALQKEYTDALKTFTDATAYKAYTDRVTAIVNTEGKAKATLDEEKNELMMAGYVLSQQKLALTNLTGDNGVINIPEKIAKCEEKIAEAQKSIDIAKALVSDENTNVEIEDYLAMLDGDIANAEAKKAVYEKLAEQYKQQLEESIKGGSSAAE